MICRYAFASFTFNAFFEKRFKGVCVILKMALLNLVVDFRYRHARFAGERRASSGQHDLGHEGVATGRGVFSL